MVGIERKWGLFGLLLFFGVGNEAEAHKSSSVLPKGVFRARIVNVVSDAVLYRFDDSGARNGLLAPLEQKIGASTLAEADPNVKQLYDSLNSFEPNLGDGLYSAQIEADSKINFHQVTAALEYGISSRVSLGVIVPYTRVEASASFDVAVSSQAAQIKEMVKGTLLEQGVQQFEGQMPGREVLAQSILVGKGYNVPADFSYQGLGDIEMGAKVQPYRNDWIQTSVQAGFRLPTATHRKDYANLLDQSTGDEQLDFALETGFETRVIGGLSTGVHSRYTWQFARSAEIPVLKDGETGLPDLTVNDSYVVVDRKLGDYLEAEAFLQYTIKKAWSPYVAYGYYAKNKDRYSGPLGYNYKSLESDTESRAHTLLAGFNFSTVKHYVEKKAALPYEIDVSFTKVLGAQNKADASFARLDFIVFF